MAARRRLIFAGAVTAHGEQYRRQRAAKVGESRRELREEDRYNDQPALKFDSFPEIPALLILPPHLMRPALSRLSRLATRPARPLLRREHDLRLRAMEQVLLEVRSGVDRNARLSHGLNTLIERIWPEEAATALQTGINTVMPHLRFLSTAPRIAVGALASLLAAGYIGRTIIYRRIADESAELGQQVLKANVENLTVTLKAVAANGETVDALVALLLELLAAETTRKALVDLLCAAYQDAGLQHKTGVFALEALDTDDARDMLDVQVQRLVSAAVLDDQVQRDTGVGVRAAIKRAVLGG